MLGLLGSVAYSMCLNATSNMPTPHCSGPQEPSLTLQLTRFINAQKRPNPLLDAHAWAANRYQRTLLQGNIM